VLPFPFHFLNNHQAMNVSPKNYRWTEFYAHVIALPRYTFSWRSIRRRFAAQGSNIPGWMNVLRAVSSEGFGRLKYFRTLRGLLDTDVTMRRFFEGETTEIPAFFRDRVQRELGSLWQFLPDGALEHDPMAYAKRESDSGKLVQLGSEQAVAGA
jgi:hypothetical protein